MKIVLFHIEYGRYLNTVFMNTVFKKSSKGIWKSLGEHIFAPGRGLATPVIAHHAFYAILVQTDQNICFLYFIPQSPPGFLDTKLVHASASKGPATNYVTKIWEFPGHLLPLHTAFMP